MTVNKTAGADEPPVVMTVALLKPTEALAAIVNVTGRLVSEPPPEIAALMPIPSNVTLVAPVRFTPVMVAGTLVP